MKEISNPILLEFSNSIKEYSSQFLSGKIVYGINSDSNAKDFFFKFIDFLKPKYNLEIDLESLEKCTNSNFHTFLINIISAINFRYAKPFCLKKECKNPKISYKTNARINKEISKLRPIHDAEIFVKKVCDMPKNYLDIQSYLKEIKELFKGLDNVKISILDHNKIAEKKMGLFLGVNQGSNERGVFVCLEYRNNSTQQPLALIGKGILFDTGGTDLKPSNYLAGMQYDMTGSAIAIGTIYALAKNNVNTSVVAICPLTTNLIGPNSIVPGDILTSYDGTTVEIDNTDAEGRLILADGISYAIKDLKCTEVATIATLTGSSSMFFGTTYTPVWCSNDNSWEDLLKAADCGGEKIWRLPLDKIYHDSIYKSRLADLINCDKSRQAGAIKAAEFLRYFAKDKRFIHFDIAGTNEIENEPIAATLRTLYYYGENYGKK